MPRTKHPRKPKVEPQLGNETVLLVQDFERQAELRIMKMEGEAKMAIKSLETFVDLTLSRLPLEIRQMTLGELLASDESNEKENCNEDSSSVDDFSLRSVPATAKGKKASKRITATSDDGYVTEGITNGMHTSKKTITSETSRRRTRSTSRNGRVKLSEISNPPTTLKVPATRGKRRPTTTDNFKTPAPATFNNNEYGVVTPKVKPNTPMSVLRRPRQGEMVLSMQGSPLLVSAVVEEDTANINVPLKNGNVISLLPNSGLRMSRIPALDPETMKQLATLKSHIETVMSAVN